MAICPNCRKELVEGAKFCNACGTRIAQPAAAPAPVVPVAPVAPQPVATPVAAPAAKKAPKEKKKFPKWILFAGIGALVLVALIVGAILLFGGKESAAPAETQHNYSLYIKDGQLYYTDLKKAGKSVQITSNLLGNSGFGDSEAAQIGSAMAYYTYVSQDGKYIFFPDHISYGDNGINLYMLELGSSKAEPVKIDSDVQQFAVNADATIVTYIRGDDDEDLYQYNIAEDSKDKIGSDVTDYRVSDDGSKIVYVNDEGSIYRKNAGSDREKIVSNASIQHIGADLQVVYYLQDGDLYKAVEGSSPAKLAENVYEVLEIYESGEMYYLVEKTSELPVLDFMIDDMAESDAQMSEPVAPQYPDAPIAPDSWEYDNWEEYEAAYDIYRAEYEAYWAEVQRLDAELTLAWEAYNMKMVRDEARGYLQYENVYLSVYALYYYNGTEAACVTDGYYNDYEDYTDWAINSALITYRAYDLEGVEKIKFSDVNYFYDMRHTVQNRINDSSKKFVAAKASATVIEPQVKIMNMKINDAGTLIYYWDNVQDGKEYGDLYCITVTDGTVGSPEKYDTDANYSNSYFIDDSQFLYFKECKNDKGELYVNKKRIDYDVFVYFVDPYSAPGKLFYFTDIENGTRSGTLKVYQDGKATKIADDAFSTFAVTADGRVLYLKDYSQNYYTGDLYEWSNGKSKEFDTDVTAVLPVYAGIYRG